MTMYTRTVIYGPPGTGKTTTLINLMEGYLNAGGQPSKVCFTSFTKKSVEEASDRCRAKFNFQQSQLPFFKTVHSLCMGLAGIKGNDVFQFKHKKEIANLLGLEITWKKSSNDGTSFGMKDGDRMFHISDFARAKKISLMDAWLKTGQEVDWAELDRFERAYREYKRSRLLIDFTDMLEKFTTQGYVPEFDVLFVDEAQDLSSLQWDAIFKIEAKADKSYIAGDDDQGIYGWNGSNVETFITLPGRQVILDKSHRLNPQIHALSKKVISSVHNRVQKEFKPRDGSGFIIDIAYLEQLPLHKGTWLLLARNGYLLQGYEEFCLQNGILYDTAGGFGPTKTDEFQAIICWENFRKNVELTNKQVELVNSFISNPEYHLTDDWVTMKFYGEMLQLPWFEVLDNIGTEKAEYFRACRRNGEMLFQKPRVHINTIHGVKGGEAENVCLITDMAHTSWKSMEETTDGYDEEHRVFYVGITRAINNLYLKQPETTKYFQL